MNEVSLLIVISIGYLCALYQTYLMFLMVRWGASNHISVMFTIIAVMWMIMLPNMHTAYAGAAPMLYAIMGSMMYACALAGFVCYTLDSLIDSQFAERRWGFVMFNTVRGSYI